MDDGALKTLFLPFDAGDLDPGRGLARWLFVNAMRPPADIPLERSQFHAVQGFKPLHNQLAAAEIAVTPEFPDEQFDGALVLISRHRGETRRFLNDALSRVKPGGTIVVSGAKTDGIAAVTRELSELFELSGSLSKNHAKVIWFINKGGKRLSVQDKALVDGRFETAAGMFSFDHVDPGSAFLIDNLPVDLKGQIADFCAGWGYLSVEAAQRCAGIKSIDLFEAHHESLESARRNMAALSPRIRAVFHWTDLAAARISGNFDAVIMNPPFHAGRSAEPALGQTIIGNAHSALHRGGRLYLVANRQLPYEATLAAMFFKSGELAHNNTYKVLWAVK